MWISVQTPLMFRNNPMFSYFMRRVLVSRFGCPLAFTEGLAVPVLLLSSSAYRSTQSSGVAIRGSLDILGGPRVPLLLRLSSAYRNTRSSSLIAENHDALPRIPSYPLTATLPGTERKNRKGKKKRPEPRSDYHYNSFFLTPLMAREVRGYIEE